MLLPYIGIIMISQSWSEPILQVDEQIDGKVFKSIKGIGPRMCFEECKANSDHCGTANYNTEQLTCTMIFKDDLGNKDNSSDSSDSAEDSKYCRRCGYISRCIKTSYTDQSTCLNLGCIEGEYLDGSECKLCPAGKYKATIGISPCLPCPKGHYQAEDGQNRCFPCPAGHYQNEEGASLCKACQTGTYMADTGAFDCISTSPGYYQNQNGQTTARPCPPGFYQDQHKQSACRRCNAGSYQNNEAQRSCIPCQEGHFLPYKGGLTSCRRCPPGTFENSTGSSSCQNCPENKFQKESGQTSCDYCPKSTCLVMNDRKQCISKSGFEFVGNHFPTDSNVMIGDYNQGTCADVCSHDDTCIEYIDNRDLNSCSIIRSFGYPVSDDEMFYLYRRKECLMMVRRG